MANSQLNHDFHIGHYILIYMFFLNPWTKEDELALTLTYPSEMYGSGASLNSNIKSRTRKCQVQNVCDDKAENAAIHLDFDHQPRDKSIIVEYNYNICRWDRAHAVMGRQTHFFYNIIWISQLLFGKWRGGPSISGPLNKSGDWQLY